MKKKTSTIGIKQWFAQKFDGLTLTLMAFAIAVGLATVPSIQNMRRNITAENHREFLTELAMENGITEPDRIDGLITRFSDTMRCMSRDDALQAIVEAFESGVFHTQFMPACFSPNCNNTAGFDLDATIDRHERRTQAEDHREFLAELAQNNGITEPDRIDGLITRFGSTMLCMSQEDALQAITDAFESGIFFVRGLPSCFSPRCPRSTGFDLDAEIERQVGRISDKDCDHENCLNFLEMHGTEPSAPRNPIFDRLP